MQLPKKRESHQLPISIQIDAVAMQKLWQWVDLAKGEVSCLGIVEELRDDNTGLIHTLLLTDFLLAKQKCTAEETEMDDAGVAELMMQLEANGIDSGKLRCWAHSHGGMSVFWSGTDDQCIEGLANDEWLLSLVVNKRRDTLMRLDQYNPCHMYIDDIAWEVLFPPVVGLAEACFEEFKSKVNEYRPIFASRKMKPPETVDELYAAHEREALTAEDLEEEFDWMGWREELDEHY